MRGSVALFRSCSVSWSKLLLLGNLICLCGIGCYWLMGRPLEDARLYRTPDGRPVPLGGQVSEWRGYRTGEDANQNIMVESGGSLTSRPPRQGATWHRHSQGSIGEEDCEEGDASCRGTSTTAEKGEKDPNEASVRSHVDSDNGTSGVRLLYSVHSLKERAQFQREAMGEFCRLHPAVKKDTPTQGEEEEDEVFKHLLYDDSKEIIFCYVPKVGCSNWKRMFVVLNGLLPPTESSKRPSEDILRSAFKLISLSPEEREWRLKKYFKITMLRNPLERIVSAYRNKVAVPIDYKHRWSFPSRDLVKMLKQFEPYNYQLWRAGEGKVDVRPSFLSFLRYLTATPRNTLNEHFRPVVDLCRPCELHYDLYTNFKFLPDDALRVMDLFNIPHHYYLNREGHPHLQTAQLVHSYFKNITLLHSTNSSSSGSGSHDSGSGLSTLQALFSSWSDELSLYYSLFPEEKDSHKKYMMDGQGGASSGPS